MKKIRDWADIAFQFSILGILTFTLVQGIGGADIQNVIIGTLVGLLTGFALAKQT